MGRYTKRIIEGKKIFVGIDMHKGGCPTRRAAAQREDRGYHLNTDI